MWENANATWGIAAIHRRVCLYQEITLRATVRMRVGLKMLEGSSSMANLMGCCPSPEVLVTMPLKTMMLSVKTNNYWCQLLPFQLSENRI